MNEVINNKRKKMYKRNYFIIMVNIDTSISLQVRVTLIVKQAMLEKLGLLALETQTKFIVHGVNNNKRKHFYKINYFIRMVNIDI